jgi:hypothetical protein
VRLVHRLALIHHRRCCPSIAVVVFSIMQSSFPPPDYHGYADYHDHYDNFEEDNHIPLPAEPKTHVNFDDPEIAALPRILLMGPRRSGKTSIQVRKQKRCAW